MAERGTRDIWFEGVFMRVQVSTEETEGRVSVMEQWAPANWSPPTHVHSKEDQVLYILEGEITAQLGGPDGPTTLVKAGESVFLPRQVPHCFLTGPEGAKLLEKHRDGRLDDIKLWDQALSSDDATNDAPVNTVPGSQTATDTAPLVFSTGTTCLANSSV